MRTPRVFAVVALLAAAAMLTWAGRSDARSLVALPTMPLPTASDRVLVVAPHPDDETLCCAGYLQRALQAGAAVAVVWVTAGDSFEIDAVIAERTLRPKGRGLEKLGGRRIAEAQAAASLLGVPRSNQFLLGYPDRGIAALLADTGDMAHRSAYTGVDSVPYAQALSPGARYTGNNLRSDLATVIGRFAPTVVLVAAPQDRHADHRAGGALARELLARRAPKARAYYWIVHAGHRWPWPLGLHRHRPLLPPAIARSLAWQQLPLDDAQQLRKLSALRAHRSQREVMGWFLNAFVRSNELFAPAAGAP
jgi:LmbE family N-acetylglucosaminyl deacetylase